ncbi:MAG: putative DNA binding domain-containing protein [Oscillospiraceae bacterium]|nr:putative DNA binding domain-containing protein [Oscillospiraceae bacterium]
MVDFKKLDSFREDNRLEAKKSEGGLPQSMWQTYSAFANTDGGIILLGVVENPDKTLNIIGIKNPEKLVTDFWNTVNNPSKVNLNIVKDKNVQIIEHENKKIIAIEIPRAERTDKPIYLKNDIWNAYRRNGDGDYRCSKSIVKAMIRDSADQTQDMRVLEKMPFSAFDYETVKGYRNVMGTTRPNHVWANLDDDDFLLKLGAIGRGDDEKLHPTAAGLLMFGFEYEIVREFPYYFLDYQEHFDIGLRWTDRITSTSGEWSGNLFEFYRKAYNKLIQNPNIKIPFKIENGFRVDDTPIHKALREALANCLINADYYGEGGVVIKNYINKIVIENPGNLRIKIEEAISGGFSSPRNTVLMKMFNLLDIGERAGSGIPNIYNIWNIHKFSKPQISQSLDETERIILIMPVSKISIKSSDNQEKVAIKSSDNGEVAIKSSDNQEKVAIKSSDNEEVAIKSSDNQEAIRSEKQKEIIIELVKEREVIKSTDLPVLLNVGKQRVRKLLLEMVNEGMLVSMGGNRNRTYRLPT